MRDKHICFLTEGYPSKNDPSFTFVRQLIAEIADQGIKCSVIAPQSITNLLFRKKEHRNYYWIDTTSKNSEIEIYQPNYISFSNFKINNTSLSHYFRRKAALKAYKKNNISADILYGHFWHNGIIASTIAEKYGLPVFIASGESEIQVHRLFKQEVIEKYLKHINGVICVSSKNRLESESLNLASSKKMTVIPNAINNEIFYSYDKNKARKKLGFNDSDFIVAFTGAFIHRKGAQRLSHALNKIGGVKSIFIGSGEEKPFGDHILFSGKLKHDEIVHYLNASDIFVLPTLAEGCSNAIIEAMACGLPIVSANLPFNDDILNNQNSIKVDPQDIEEISEAIKYLIHEKEIKEKMSRKVLETANNLDIQTRATRILNYMDKNL